MTRAKALLMAGDGVANSRIATTLGIDRPTVLSWRGLGSSPTDWIRTTTLFAALNVLTGEVIGQCHGRHRHQEFLKFLRHLDRAFPRDLTLHVILDNYATHKHKAIRKWLAAHPRFKLHFTPTSASWLNLVESWFSKLTQRRLRRGVFCRVQELVTAIKDYLAHHNADPKPFVWSTTVDAILEKVRKCKVIPGTHH